MHYLPHSASSIMTMKSSLAKIRILRNCSLLLLLLLGICLLSIRSNYFSVDSSRIVLVNNTTVAEKSTNQQANQLDQEPKITNKTMLPSELVGKWLNPEGTPLLAPLVADVNTAVTKVLDLVRERIFYFFSSLS